MQSKKTLAERVEILELNVEREHWVQYPPFNQHARRVKNERLDAIDKRLNELAIRDVQTDASTEAAEAEQGQTTTGAGTPFEGAVGRIGDRVFKHTGDYQIEGCIVAVFRPTADSGLRYVVRHEAKGGGWFCHIYSGANIRRID